MGQPLEQEIPNIFIWLAGLFVCAVILWDTWAATSGHEQLEISQLVFSWSRLWPALPFAAGFLCGHLFWRK